MLIYEIFGLGLAMLVDDILVRRFHLGGGRDNIRCSSLVATRPIQRVSPADGQCEGSAIFTDPPYGIHYANFACDKLRGTKRLWHRHSTLRDVFHA